MTGSSDNYSRFSSSRLPLDRNKKSKRNDAAEAFFRSIKKVKSEEDRKRCLAYFKTRWPGYVPEPFYTTGNYKRRKAYTLLRGQTSTNPFDNCGIAGRLRILAGKPLERSIISFSQLPRVREWMYDFDAQFHQQIMDWVKEDLVQFFVKGPFIAFVECGKNGKNHVNVLHKKGACKRGTTRLVPDKRLFATLAYFSKKFYWNDDNALAYLKSANMNKRVGRRIIKHRLGDSRTKLITVIEVEMLLNMSLLQVIKIRITS